MLFEEKRYVDAVKNIAKDPAKFSNFLTKFAIDVRGEMEEDDRDVFDFYVLTVLPGAVVSGGDTKVVSKLMIESLSKILLHNDEGDSDEAECK